MSKTASRRPSSGRASAPGDASTGVGVRGSRCGRHRGQAHGPSRSCRRRRGRRSFVRRSRSPASTAPGGTDHGVVNEKFRAPQTMPRTSSAATSTWHHESFGRCCESPRRSPQCGRARWDRTRRAPASRPSRPRAQRARGGRQHLGRPHRAAGRQSRAPRQRRAHRRSRPSAGVKRTSPSTMSRMSVMPCWNIRVRSRPIPNAKPRYRTGSTPQATRTRGLTMPQPPHRSSPRSRRYGRGHRDCRPNFRGKQAQ